MNRVDLLDARWRKSSRSNGNYNCVEVAFTQGDTVALRDSKNPTGAVLAFNAGEWGAFLGGVEASAFRRP